MHQSQTSRTVLASVVTYLVIGFGTAMASDDTKNRDLTIILPGHIAEMVVVDPIGRVMTEGLSSIPGGQLSYHGHEVPDTPGPMTVAALVDPLPGAYLIYMKVLKDGSVPTIGVKLEMGADHRCTGRLNPAPAEDIRSGVLVARFEIEMTGDDCRIQVPG